jgi:Undecaprenyl-phosphate glucose phosphotransferase
MAQPQIQTLHRPFEIAPSPAVVRARPTKPNWRLGPLAFSYAAALADVLAILIAALTSALLEGLAGGSFAKGLPTGLTVGILVAVLVVLVAVHKDAYSAPHYSTTSGQIARAFPLWNSTTLAALALGVATRSISDFPRAGLLLFYVLGFIAVVAARRGVGYGLETLREQGRASRRRIAVVGFEPQIVDLLSRETLDEDGAEIACSFVLRESDAFFADDLALAAAAIRLHRADDVFVSLPWSRADLIDTSIAALTKLPIEVHLGLGGSLQRIRAAQVARVGQVAGLTITRKPLGVMQQIEKRAFDVCVSVLALALLSPLFAITALLIRLGSRGPALFRQKRYGLNQEPFRIFKFRTMRTMDDGAVVRQATRSDSRVTRIGAHLRRLSIDELPQLLNVLIGDMSIVGPRPHALAHDQLYVEKLALYARRHNVKPGITGWAQVCGHRGEIADDCAMLARLDHDLYYIDHWSLWFDVKIMFMTVLSRKAHANAY